MTSDWTLPSVRIKLIVGEDFIPTLLCQTGVYPFVLKGEYWTLGNGIPSTY